jgi:glutathione S-transferase
VLISLEEKGVEYASTLLSMADKQHKTPEILAINPRGQMPSMKVCPTVQYRLLDDA